MDIGEQLKVIAEPTRLKIIQLLLQRHHCARSLSTTLGISESAVSQHMSVLKKAGLVTSCRHGYHVHYILQREAFAAIAAEFQRWLQLMDGVCDCHTSNPCQFKLDDGNCGCLYRTKMTVESER